MAMSTKELNLLLALATSLLKSGETDKVIELFEETIKNNKPEKSE